MIADFSVLSPAQMREFAEELLRTINSNFIFTKQTEFKVDSVNFDDLTGNLTVEVSQTVPIEVSRKATWTCDEAEDAEVDPGFEANYSNRFLDDAKKTFKTFSADVNGYEVTLEVTEVNEVSDEAVEVTVDSLIEEDAGIGDYEYFGFKGTDSQPYYTVEGTIVRECECCLAFVIEPNNIIVEPDEI